MPEQPSQPQPQAATISAEKLCGLTGLTDRRHRQLAKEGLFPPPVHGLYQLVPTIQGLFKHYREQQAKKTGALAEEKEKKLRAERKHKELDLSIRRGEYVHVPELRRDLVKCVGAMTTDILAIPQVAPQVIGISAAEAYNLLSDECHRALTQLSELTWLRHIPSSAKASSTPPDQPPESTTGNGVSDS